MSYINYLFEINKTINNINSIRDTKHIEQISNAIHEALCSEGSEVLNKSMKAASLVKLYQPFYDGNNRTALILFGHLIEQKGYLFDYQEALNDINNHLLNIPTIYTEDDEITNIGKWNKYIEKQTILKK